MSARAMKLRIFAVAALISFAVALGLPELYRALLGLDAHEALLTRFCVGAFGPLGTLAAAIALFRLDAKDRKSVLELPGRLARGLVAAGALVLAALTAVLLAGEARAPIVIGLGLCSAALFALPVVPLYAFSRATLLQLAVRLGDESPPQGRRLGLKLQIAFTVIAVSAAALVPASLFGAAQLERLSLEEAQARAQLAAARLAAAAERVDVAAATKLVTRTPLDGGERTVLVAPSGTHLPDDVGSELDTMPYVEVPLAGALQGGSLRVYYPTRARAHTPLYVTVLLLIALTIWSAARAARTVSDDVVGITRQIDRVAHGEPPGELGRLSTLEVRRVALAVNRLLERIPRLTVESFLAIERATEAQRLKSQFLANMSHDLRSPLNSILGFSELLLRNLEGDIQPGQRVTLAAMHATGLRLLRLLNEILDTAKVESGKMELHRQSASPAELVRQASAEARRGRAPADVERLSIELQPGLAPIFVDPLRITQVVTHLCNHAFDHARKGRMVLRVQDVHDDGQRSFSLEIEYDGPLPDRDHLFDGFQIGGTRPGLHLPLPLAKRLVELHGGTVDLVQASPRVCIRATVPVLQTRRQA